MSKTLVKWAFWNAVYLFRPSSKDLAAYLTRGGRTRWPWRKFKPAVLRNDDGKQWEIYLSDDMSYTDSQVMLKVLAHISMETGNIVGFTVWDETLKRIENGDK